MRRTARFIALAAFVTLGASAVVAPRQAFAQSAEAMQAERARLRGQLDKVNAEIDALKRASGGVRDDYRLRARLADAESLARRLMEIEARLGIRVDGTAKPQPPPIAEPTDSPADLDAKADILADQSRRVRVQADLFARRAIDVKGRQELRRRAADLDRDPFAPMEGSKRRVASGSGTAASPAGGAAIPISSPSSPRNDSAVTPGISPPSGGGGNNFGNGNGNGLTTSAAAPPSIQLRDLLDTATLTDLRRLEASGAAIGSPQALERAAAALRARADWLDAQSRAMRTRAQAK
ncbi:MAG TPA: hypothetical protein VKQ32_17585 [Polyangia bacterium]|nr:hypothetical protein [Polyangia bacterium]